MLAAFFFTVQIYCDFSGYSDIARGCSKMLGIDLMENFRSPYFPAGIREFWSRWHISLSTWFRDYVYIPLGGSMCGKFRHNVNLMITFTVSGLWHGANWTFVIWGAVHGLAQIAENSLTLKREPHGVVRALRVIVTFVFVMTAWVFFRANTLSDAFYIFTHMFTSLHVISLGAGLGLHKLLAIMAAIAATAVYDLLSLKYDVIALSSSANLACRWILYNILTASIFILYTGFAVSNAAFVYFQF